MIIWSGRGYYILLVGICFQVLARIMCSQVLGDPNLYKASGWPKAVALVLAAAVVWPLAKNLEGRTAYGIDSATGERVAYTPRDTFFFIPMGATGRSFASCSRFTSESSIALESTSGAYRPIRRRVRRFKAGLPHRGCRVKLTQRSSRLGLSDSIARPQWGAHSHVENALLFHHR